MVTVPAPQPLPVAAARAAAVADTLWRPSAPTRVSGPGRRIEIPQPGRIDLERGTFVLLLTPTFDAADGSIQRDLFGTGE